MSDLIVTEVTEDPYTIVPNYIINDPTWSVATKMTWIWIFSKRRIPGWKIRPLYIQKVMGYSDWVWRRVYKDLMDGGYISTSKTKHGTIIKFIYDWSFSSKYHKTKLELVKAPVDNPVDE